MEMDKTKQLNVMIVKSGSPVYWYADKIGDVFTVYDFDSGSIQPFYRFHGYGYTQDGAKIEVGVIITALPQNLYQK